MAAKRKWTEEQLMHMRELFHSDLPNTQVGKALGCDYNRSVKSYWIMWFGEEAVHGRFRRLCALSKQGHKNPMTGKSGKKHPRHKDDYINWQGYRFVDAPAWYEGTTKAGKVMEHVCVGCEKYALRSLPKGYVIHHKDEDKLNNHPDNLELLTISQHMKVHAELRRNLKV